MTWLTLLRKDEPGWVRPAPDRAGYRRDAQYAIGLLLVGLALTQMARAAGTHPYGHSTAAWIQVVMVAATALPLALRRRFPEIVAVWESAGLIGWQVVGMSEALSINIYVFVALFTLGAWGRHRARADAVRFGIFLAMLAWLATAFGISVGSDAFDFPGAPGLGPVTPVVATVIYALVSNVIYFGAAWYFGNNAWTSARRGHDLAERTLALQAERETNARTAVVGERVRIARELHDVVAHSVSLMGVQAAAARRSLDKDPATATQFLDAVEHTARSTVGELAGLLGVLRSDDTTATVETASGHVGIGAIDDIVSAARDAGLDATATVVGEPFPLSEGTSVSLYRVTQEAVTNTIRHARASKVDIRVRYLGQPATDPAASDDRRGVEVEIVDDGLPAVAGTAGTGLGHVGMAERMGLHGGELTVGPRTTTRGYRVLARVPVAAGERTGERADERANA
jgi:signal transduction histidine kinase